MPRKLDLKHSTVLLQVKMPSILKKYAVRLATDAHLNESEWIRQLIWREWESRPQARARRRAARTGRTL